jgi:hypothetical protein
MRVEKLNLVPVRTATAQTHVITWRKLSKPTASRAKAEMLMRFARVDDADAIVRVR